MISQLRKLPKKHLARIISLFELQDLKLAAQRLKIDVRTFRKSISLVEEVLCEKIKFDSDGQLIASVKLHRLINELKSLFETYEAAFEFAKKEITTYRNSVKLICPPKLASLLTALDTIKTQKEKYTINLFTTFEMFNSDPKVCASWLEEHDCIFSLTPIHYIDPWEWKLNYSNANLSSAFYVHQNFAEKYRDISIKTLAQHEILNDKQITTMEFILQGETKNYAFEIQPSISSDSLLVNLQISRLSDAIVVAPIYLKAFLLDDFIPILPHIRLMGESLYIYSKTNLPEKNQKILEQLISAIKAKLQ